jgi:hypothetical protein
MTWPVAFGDRIKEPVPDGVNGAAEAKVRIILDELASFFSDSFLTKTSVLKQLDHEFGTCLYFMGCRIQKSLPMSPIHSVFIHS